MFLTIDWILLTLLDDLTHSSSIEIVDSYL